MKNIKNKNANTVIIAVVALIIIALVAAIIISSSSNAESSKMVSDSAMMEKDKMVEQEDAMMMEEPNGNDAMMEVDDSKDSMMEENKMDEESPAMMENEDEAMLEERAMSSGEYLSYSLANYEKTEDSKRVLFFHASWCPTCKSADANFNSNLEKLPSGVTLLKVDYDSEGELKKKYGITYQHTFVQVDAEGTELAKWNGGEIDELIKKVK